jgi:hypothetical protein
MRLPLVRVALVGDTRVLLPLLLRLLLLLVVLVLVLIAELKVGLLEGGGGSGDCGLGERLMPFNWRA